MGNVVNRHKEFQSVAPFPVEGGGESKTQSTPSPQRKKSMLKHSSATEPEAPMISPVVVITHETSGITLPTSSQSSLARPEPPVNEAVISIDGFDFRQTESQLRRKGMADCEFECSQIEPFLFVGGYHVAGNWELLKSNGITRVVNCSSAVVSNHFISDPSMTYYSMNMVDGRQDDIFWFLADVIQFVIKGKILGEKTLIHCEKGISRSCSFAIAYRMWSSGDKWKAAFDYVKERRPVCAPNTAFTCNLIELGEIFAGEASSRNLIFRCAYHLPHDPLTCVLKLCRSTESRKIIPPSTSMLDPKGVFVIRCTRDMTNDQLVFIWKGAQASTESLEKARALTAQFYGVVTNCKDIIIIEQGQETELFLSSIIDDGKFGEGGNQPLDSSVRPQVPYEDLYDNKPSMEAALQFQREHEQMRISRDRPPPMINSRQTSIQGFDTSSETEYFKPADAPNAISPEFKLAKIPSLKFSVEPSTASAGSGLVASRRNSHSKPVVLSRASSIKRDEFVNNQSTDGYTTASSVTASKDLSLNLGMLSAGSPLTDSPSLLRRNNESPVNTNSASTKAASRFAVSEPPISEFTPRDSARDSARDSEDNSAPPTARQSLIEKIGLAVSGIAEISSTNTSAAASLIKDSTSSRPSGVMPSLNLGGATNTSSSGGAKPSVAMPSLNLSGAVGSSSNNNNSSGSSSSGAKPNVAMPSLNLNISSSSNASTTTATSKAPQLNVAQRVKDAVEVNSSRQQPPQQEPPTSRYEKTETAAPPTSRNNIRFQESEKEDGNSGSHHHSKMDVVKAAEPTSSAGDVPVVFRNSSRSRLVALIAGTPERPGSASEHKTLQRNSSRVLPFVGTAGSETTTEPTTSTTAAASAATASGGHSSSSSGGGVPKLSTPQKAPAPVVAGSASTTAAASAAASAAAAVPSLSTPQIDRMMKTETKTPENTPVKPTPASLQLPAGAILRSPSVEKHPENISLSRGPTPAEDLAVPLSSHRIISPSQSTNKITAAPVALPPMTKPLLYQAVVKKSSKRRDENVYEWQAMGVYDDEDLNEMLCLLLLCPDNQHYLWLGADFDIESAGILVDEGADVPSDSNIVRWCCGVLNGEVKHDNMTGKHLSKRLRVIRAGEETDEFWAAFNEGY